MKTYFQTTVFVRRFAVHFVVCLALVATALFLYRSERRATREEALNELRAISALKTAQLTQWLRERKSEAAFFSGSEPFRTEFIALAGQKPANDTLLRESLQKIMSDNRYEQIFLLGAQGNLIFSANPDFVAIDTATAQYSSAVFRSRQITVSDICFCSIHNEPHYEILAPVFDLENRVAATLVFRINPNDYLYPLIETWPGLSKTSEILIVRREGDSILFLNRLRHLPQNMFPYSLPLSQAPQPAAMAVVGRSGFLEAKDYSGDWVLADIGGIPGTSWYMVVKKSSKEVYQAMNKQILLLIIITLLSLFFLNALFQWILSNRQKNLFKELFASKSELFQAQEAFRAILYSMGDGVITTNLKGLVAQMNPVAEALTGWSEKEAKGRPLEEVFSIINEESRQKVENPAVLVLKEGKVVGLANHTILLSKRGEEIPIDDSGAPIRDHEGTIQGVVLIFRDRTEERMRQNLSEIRTRLIERAASHSRTECISLTLNDICLLFRSRIAFLQLFQSSLEESILFESDFPRDPDSQEDASFHQLLSSEWLSNALIRGESVIENNKSGFPSTFGDSLTRFLAVPVVRKNATVALLVLCNKVDEYTPFDKDSITFLADLLFETAQRKKQEENLRDSEERHRNLIEQMQLGLAVHEMIFDEKGNPVDYRFLDVNKSFEKITTLRREEVIGRTVLEILPQTEKIWIDRYGSVVLTGEPVAFENYAKEFDRYYSVIAYKYRHNAFAVIIEDITHRKQMEATLRESEERYRLIMDNSLDAVLLTKPDGSILAANRAACEMFRMTEEEICESGREGIVDLSDPRLPEMIETREREGRVQGELTFVRKGGVRFPTEVSSSLFQNSKGERFTSMTIRDLSQQKAALDALRESENNYKELIDGMSETVWVISFDGRLIDLNKMAVSTLGYTKEELLSIGLLGIDAALSDEEIRHLTETMESDKLQIFETAHKTKSGKIFPVEIYSSIVNYQGQKAILSIARDITQRKHDENVRQILYKIAGTSSTTKALEDLLIVVREELSRVLDTTNFYVALLDPTKEVLRKVVFMNEKINLKEWGIHNSLSGQVILQKRSILLKGEERPSFELRHSITLPVTPAECWLGVPILVDDEPLGVLVVQSYTNRDAYNEQHLLLLETVAHELAIVFQRKAMIQDLISAKEKAEESDRLKTAFLANMSHEIRTPMNAILGFLSLLEEPELEEENRREYIEIVNKSGQRLLETINDIIEISKIEAGELELRMETVKLSEVIQYHYDLFKLQVAGKGLSFRIAPIEAPDTVLTDKNKLEGILTNLIKNAIKFTSKGTIEIGCYREGEWLHFYVKDTGRGISPQKLNAIFERFVQADLQISRPYEGSGLGLSIVKGYVGALKGKIWVESEENQGSTFHFVIPFLPV